MLHTGTQFLDSIPSLMLGMCHPLTELGDHIFFSAHPSLRCAQPLLFISVKLLNTGLRLRRFALRSLPQRSRLLFSLSCLRSGCLRML